MKRSLGKGGLAIKVRGEVEGGRGKSHAQTQAALHSAGTLQSAGEARGGEARPLACGFGVVEAEGSNVSGGPVSRTPRDRKGRRDKGHTEACCGGRVDDHSERRRQAWDCMRAAALHAPAVLGCALTEEDQGCRNGQMRKGRETVGYMVYI